MRPVADSQGQADLEYTPRLYLDEEGPAHGVGEVKRGPQNQFLQVSVECGTAAFAFAAGCQSCSQGRAKSAKSRCVFPDREISEGFTGILNRGLYPVT
jgi:hypothetical protein